MTEFRMGRMVFGQPERTCLNKLVVCEVPEAGLSANDKTTDSDEVYFNTKVHKYIFTTSR